METKEGIILDDLYSYAFLGKAINDNFISTKNIGINKFCAEKIALSVPYQQTALEMCLLYEKVFLHNIEEEELVYSIGGNDLVEILEEHPDLSPRSYFPNFYTDEGRYLKWLLLPKIEDELLKIDDNVSFAYDLLLRHLKNPVSLLESRFDNKISQSQKKYNAMLQSKAFKLALQIKSVSSLLSFNSEYQIPIITTRAKLTNSSEYLATEDNEIELYDNVYKAYKVYLDEISLVPKVRTIEDVIRLRKDKRIVEFREALTNWGLEIREGDPKTEKRMREEIQKANEELKKIGEFQKIGKWVTYISLPISIAGAFSGYSLGLTLIPISVGARILSDLHERKYRWLLFGR